MLEQTKRKRNSDQLILKQVLYSLIMVSPLRLLTHFKIKANFKFQIFKLLTTESLQNIE